MIFLPTNLRYLRESKGLTQSQLAENIGVRPNTVSNYETGNSSPDFELLGIIIKIFDIDAHSFLFTDMRAGDFPGKPTRADRVPGIRYTGTLPATPGNNGASCFANDPYGDYGNRLRKMREDIEGLKETVSRLSGNINSVSDVSGFYNVGKPAVTGVADDRDVSSPDELRAYCDERIGKIHEDIESLKETVFELLKNARR